MTEAPVRNSAAPPARKTSSDTAAFSPQTSPKCLESDWKCAVTRLKFIHPERGNNPAENQETARTTRVCGGVSSSHLPASTRTPKTVANTRRRILGAGTHQTGRARSDGAPGHRSAHRLGRAPRSQSLRCADKSATGAGFRSAEIIERTT